MSDTRLVLVGVALVFAGFLVLGIFGSQYGPATVESQQFGDCHQYFEDRPPQRTDCSIELLYKTLFFVLVVALIAAGIVFLVRGARGDWDQRVAPGDLVGPGGPAGAGGGGGGGGSGGAGRGGGNGPGGGRPDPKGQAGSGANRS